MLTADELQELARIARVDTLKALWAAQSGHPGSSLSAMDVLISAYFGGHLRYRPDDPEWKERDIFILSQGHAAPGYYSVLALAGFLPRRELGTLRQLDSRLEGHVKRGSVPGVECSTGSLGQGLNFATGVAVGIKRTESDRRVYVMTSDGDQQEGSTWEAIMFAASNNLSSLIVFVDMNKNQINGPVEEIQPVMTTLRPKYEAFGWFTKEIDGDDMNQIRSAIDEAKDSDRPAAILCRTVTGKGVPFMEGDFHWHHGRLSEDLFLEAMKALGESVSETPDDTWEPGHSSLPPSLIRAAGL